MERRAFYRWKSFWLGVLVLACLGWAWARSMEWDSGVTWEYPRGNGHGMSAWQAKGGVCVTWDSYRPPDVDGMWHWKTAIPVMDALADEPLDGIGLEEQLMRERARIGSGLFPKGLVVEGAVVRVAHWVLWLAFFLAWSGWLVWRWWREFASLKSSVPSKRRR